MPTLLASQVRRPAFPIIKPQWRRSLTTVKCPTAANNPAAPMLGATSAAPSSFLSRRTQPTPMQNATTVAMAAIGEGKSISRTSEAWSRCLIEGRLAPLGHAATRLPYAWLTISAWDAKAKVIRPDCRCLGP